MFSDDRADKSFMPDMITMFGNSSFQLSIRLFNIRRVTIVTRYFVNDIAFRCMRTNVLLYFYVFFVHFVGAMKGNPDVVLIKSSEFLHVRRNVWNQNKNTRNNNLLYMCLCIYYLNKNYYVLI